MKFHLGEAKLGGRFRLVASTDSEGNNVTKDTGWFDNLITDSGLERIGQVNSKMERDFRNYILRAFRVGSGTATPTFTDTSLGTEIAAISLDSVGYNAYISSSDSNFADGYMHMTLVRQFGQGAAEGNLSEIGLGDLNDLCSHALIVDVNGDPTTITILSNEYLTVYYTLRCYIPQSDVVISAHPVLIDGVSTPHDITIRAGSANNYESGLINRVDEYGWNTYPYAEENGAVTNGGLIAETSTRSGTFATSHTFDAYVPGSLERWANFYWGLNTANFTINTFLINMGLGVFQFNIVPGLDKDNTKVLNAKFGYSWTRDTPPP